MERKFRAIPIFSNTDEYVYGWYTGNCNFIAVDGFNDRTYFQIIPGSVGQWTGCRDKCDIDIYENDIVDYINGYFKVVYEIGAFMLVSIEDANEKYLLKNINFDLVKVVGNEYALEEK